MNSQPRERGFSLVELIAVIAIIAAMAAFVIPRIAEWMNYYNLQAGRRGVAAELQGARIQAIMKNTKKGVTLFVLDANSYRWVNNDLAELADPNATGPLRDLPQDIEFDATDLPGGVATDGVRFSRLGAACAQQAGSSCAVTAPVCPETGCNDLPSGTAHFVLDAANNITRVRLLDKRRGLFSVLDIDQGGRVREQEK